MNLPDLGKMKEMMTQAREMQAQMEEKLAATIVEAESGGGMVSVRMNGAGRRADAAMKSSVTSMMGGLNLPGLG